jgi:hypothetical protein
MIQPNYINDETKTSGTIFRIESLDPRLASDLEFGLWKHWAKVQLRFVCVSFLSLLSLTYPGHAKPVGSVQIINTNAGRIMTAHADQYGDTVYIGGLAYRPSGPGIGAHVNVWGIDREGKVVFTKTTSIYFTGKPSLVHTASYIVSVSPAIFLKSKTIYVTFHSSVDTESRTAEPGK